MRLTLALKGHFTIACARQARKALAPSPKMILGRQPFIRLRE
jgi:hypothetical protein